MDHVIDIYVKRKHLITTKVLNECKFQHIHNAGKGKENGLNTCITI